MVYIVDDFSHREGGYELTAVDGAIDRLMSGIEGGLSVVCIAIISRMHDISYQHYRSTNIVQ